jgi:ParB-like chromosome segregation protein Spo0J
MTQLTLAFLPDPLSIALDLILPSRKASAGILVTRKFLQIQSSIKAVGIIEPLTVGPADKKTGHRILIDGHLRLLALRTLEQSEAPCLESTDDESYTYNTRINRLSSIQEHLMLRRAVERGVTAKRLADALDLDISSITRKLTLLDGICAEAATILKDQQFSANLGSVLRKMKPTRQVECVELMVSANNVTMAYANALFAATPASQLMDASKAKKVAGVSAAQMANMEREMGNLQDQYKLAEQNFSQDVFQLFLARTFLSKLLANVEVDRYLQQHHADILTEFKSIVEAESLDA